MSRPGIGKFLSIFFVFYSFSAIGQSADFFIINQVILEGNDKTKEVVIFNELDFVPGDTLFITQFANRKLLNEKRLFSTALFTAVEINIKNWNVENKPN